MRHREFVYTVLGLVVLASLWAFLGPVTPQPVPFTAVNARIQDGSGNLLTSAISTPASTVRGLVTRNLPSGTQTVSEAGLATIVTGQQAVTTTATALPSNTATRVCVRALATSAQAVYIGDSTVRIGTGQELNPMDAWCGPLDNTDRLSVISTASGAGVSWDAIR